MSAKRLLKSAIADLVTRYLTHMQANAGRVFKFDRCILFAFDNYCADNNILSPLTEAAFTGYAQSGLCTLRQRGNRYRVLYRFYDFCRDLDETLPQISRQATSLKGPRHLSYIYSDEEIRTLMNFPQSDCCDWSDERAMRWQCLIGILAATGMRVGEVIGLKLSDVDERACVLTVREGKFRKSRLVPVDGTVIEAIAKYSNVRLRQSSEYLFTTKTHDRVAYTTICSMFNQALSMTKIGIGAATKPRIHDFRHTFAVRTVVDWTSRGMNVQCLLPVLATYLGHSHFSDTAYYLESSSELLRPVAERISLVREK